MTTTTTTIPWRRLQAFRQAIAPGAAATIKRRLQGGIPVDVDVDGDGVTPLHLAALRAADDVVAVLLAHGADPHHITARGDSLVDAAAWGGNARVMQLLVEQRAPLSTRALSSALSRGHFAAARVLIDAGVDVDTLDPHAARPLVHAIHHGADTALVEALLARSTIAPGASALWAAADRDRADLLPLLARHGGDLQVVDNDGRSLLARAIGKGSDTAAAWLRATGLPEPTEPTAPAPPQSLLRPGMVLEGTLRGFAGRGRVAADGTVLVRVEVFGRATDVTLDAAWFRFDDEPDR